jgi:hypothetical protein
LIPSAVNPVLTMYIGYHAYFNCEDMDWQCNMIIDPDKIIEENKNIHKARRPVCSFC